MITTFFRSSSFNCHSACPMAFFIEYLLGWRGLSGQAADRGTVFHKNLEVIAKVKKALQDGLTYIEDDIVGKRSITDTGHIEGFNTSDDLVKEVYDYYTKRLQHHTWKPIDLKNIQKWVREILVAQGGQYNPLNREIVAVEQHFDIELEDDWANYSFELNGEKIEGKLHLIGTIDLITKYDDCLEITDYKTSKDNLDFNTGKEKNTDTLNEDPQFLLYYLACSYLYPEFDAITATIYFVKAGGPCTVVFDKSYIPKAKEIIRQKFEEIKNTDKPRLNKSWKCSKTCAAGKTTFEGTTVKSGKEYRSGQVCKRGEPLTKCEQTKFLMDKFGTDWCLVNLKNPDHHFNLYKAPGEV